jgi:hypothetical protein
MEQIEIVLGRRHWKRHFFPQQWVANSDPPDHEGLPRQGDHTQICRGIQIEVELIGRTSVFREMTKERGNIFSDTASVLTKCIPSVNTDPHRQVTPPGFDHGADRYPQADERICLSAAFMIQRPNRS